MLPPDNLSSEQSEGIALLDPTSGSDRFILVRSVFNSMVITEHMIG